MTIPTPTSDLSAGAAGLPDVATLTRLAGEFFATLPGGGSSPASQAHAFAGAAPATAAPAAPLHGDAADAWHTPAIAPAAAPAVPAPASAAAAPTLGVPQAYAAALPQVGSTGPSVPGPSSVPYYFLGAPGADAVKPAVVDDRIGVNSFGMPGIDALADLIAQIDTGRGSSQSAGSGKEQHYYFVDPVAPVQAQAAAHPPFDVHAVRRDFPILAERVEGRQLVWLDNAATTHKPQAVIDRLVHFYQHENSNIHRAAHTLAARATDAYEGARNKIARFLGAGSVEEIIFVRGATEGINLIAKSWGAKHIGAGDEIVVSHLEHHANIVPWQQLAAEKGARLRVIPVDDQGQILLDEYRKLLNDRTKLVAITQVSNALGTVTPVREIVAQAHQVGAIALVDGAQAVSHMRVNVQALDADFYVLSGHKMFAPTGIGVVYGKRAVLEQTPPWQGGGNMIADVTFERTIYQAPPARFEAGTGNIADAVGLGAAVDYLERIGMENIAQYEHALLVYAMQRLATVPGLRQIGTAADKASVLSFVLEGYKTEEVGSALSREGIAVRSGHHCAQPILRRFGLEATVRPSLAFYNTCAEVDALVAALLRLRAAR